MQETVDGEGPKPTPWKLYELIDSLLGHISPMVVVHDEGPMMISQAHGQNSQTLFHPILAVEDMDVCISTPNLQKQNRD